MSTSVAAFRLYEREVKARDVPGTEGEGAGPTPPPAEKESSKPAAPVPIT
jgi:hypothetical protein